MIWKFLLSLFFLSFFALPADSFAQQIRLNEVASSNSVFEDEDGDKPDWFELYNTAGQPLNLSGWTITDNKDKPAKWAFPAVIIGPGEYLLIWASGKDRDNHSNFKISSAGETIYLFNPNQQLIDELPAENLPADISFGIAADGSKRYFETPTPGQPNGGLSYAGISLAHIDFSHPGGPVDTFSLILSGLAATDTIRYTLDASLPHDSSAIYTGPIPIRQHTVVRARVMRADVRPSPLQSHSYLVNTRHQLPIISLVTDPYNFFDDDYGMYVYGNSYSPELPHFGANFWEDWERPLHFTLYEKDGSLGTSFEAGAKIFGAWSRANDQRSFSIFARKKYGTEEINYPLFPQLPYQNFQAIVLRNAGNDWLNSMMRDAVLTGLMHDTDLSVQAYRPAVTYINGTYWGFYNMREKINEHMLASKHQLNPDDIDLLEAGGDIVQGDNRDYLNLIHFLQTNNLVQESPYAHVANEIDIDNFILYYVTQIYIDNQDWPGNNVKFWRANGSKWKWILYDTDFGFGIWNTNNYQNNTLAFALEPNGPGWPNPPWSTLLFRRLTQNLGFRQQFVNQFADELNSRFLPERVTHFIDSLSSAIEPEIQAHYVRWGGFTGYWRDQVSNMKIFANNRQTYLKSHIRNQFRFPAFHTLRLENEDPKHGYIQLNSLTIKQKSWQGDYFQTVPITLTAIPQGGMVFSHWEGAGVSDSTQLQIEVDMKGPMTIIPHFIEEPIELGNIIINEINYQSDEAFNTDDWVELHNVSSKEIDLSGWELKGNAGRYVIPPGRTLAPQAYLVLAKSIFAFRAIYPDIRDAIGGFAFDLSKEGDVVRLLDRNAVQQDVVAYMPEAPWPLPARGRGPTMELLDPSLDNSLPENWASIHTVGSPGESNIASTKYYFEGFQQYPNPFGDQAQLDFHLVGRSLVVAELYDLSGAKVYTLFEGELETGAHQLKADLGFLSSGLYILRFRKGDEPEVVTQWVKSR